MADPLMGWDAKQSRWRKMYKGRPLRIRAVDLGGTNRTDTVVAANQWFRQEQDRIDKELAQTTYRPNELAYRAELENVQSAIKSFLLVIKAQPDTQSMLSPNVELLKHKESLLKQALQQDTLPPLDDLLRNPIYISPESIEEAAIQDAKQALRKRGYPALSPREKDLIREVDGKEYIVKKVVQRNADGDYDGTKEVMYEVEKVIDERLTRTIGMKDKMLAYKKRELGLIESEYERGVITQLLKEQGAEVPESRQLDYHIDKFLEIKRREYKLGTISAGRLRKLIDSINHYKKWTTTTSVDRLATKEHIDAYHRFLSDRILAKELKPRSANDLFADFLTLIRRLFREEVLKDLPRCLQIKNHGYKFHVPRQKPKTVPLELIRPMLDAANPRLKLFILLTLNCGFGASEIGHLTYEEYNPTTGRITRRRHKTGDCENVPEVCYRLWDETKVLLDQAIAERPKLPQRPEFADRLLVNRNGNPVWSEHFDDDGKLRESDSVTSSFKRLVEQLRTSDSDFPTVAYYQFRRTGATLIDNERKFRGLTWLWLGHAPKTMAGQSYVDPDDTILDECIGWLHDKIFSVESPPEGQNVKMGKE